MKTDAVEAVIAAVNELPDMDYVHCYDYEIRTDNLKALAADHSALQARVLELEGAHCPKCGMPTERKEQLDEEHRIIFVPWWAGSQIEVTTFQNPMTGMEILKLMKNHNLQMPQQGPMLLEMLPYGTSRVIAKHQEVSLIDGMKFTVDEGLDNA